MAAASTIPSDLPGIELVRAGLDDLHAGRDTASAAAVAMASRRLRAAGVAVPAVSSNRLPRIASMPCSSARTAATRTRVTTRSCAGWSASRGRSSMRGEADAERIRRLALEVFDTSRCGHSSVLVEPGGESPLAQHFNTRERERSDSGHLRRFWLRVGRAPRGRCQQHPWVGSSAYGSRYGRGARGRDSRRKGRDRDKADHGHRLLLWGRRQCSDRLG